MSGLKAYQKLVTAVGEGQGAVSASENENYNEIFGGDYDTFFQKADALNEFEKSIDTRINITQRDYVYQDPENTTPYQGGGEFDAQPDD